MLHLLSPLKSESLKGVTLLRAASPVLMGEGLHSFLFIQANPIFHDVFKICQIRLIIVHVCTLANTKFAGSRPQILCHRCFPPNPTYDMGDIKKKCKRGSLFFWTLLSWGCCMACVCSVPNLPILSPSLIQS